MPREITVPVRLDAAAFRRFGRYDALVLRRGWVRPAAFAAILCAFAAAALVSRRPQSGLIAGVLLAVGLGLPLVYFGTFLSQLRAQAAASGLDTPRHVYTVSLDFDGVRVENARREEPPQKLAWRGVHAAFRVKDGVYLYATPARAFLLPAGQADCGDDALWACLGEHMPGRCHDRRPRRSHRSHR